MSSVSSNETRHCFPLAAETKTGHDLDLGDAAPAATGPCHYCLAAPSTHSKGSSISGSGSGECTFFYINLYIHIYIYIYTSPSTFSFFSPVVQSKPKPICCYCDWRAAYSNAGALFIFTGRLTIPIRIARGANNESIAHITTTLRQAKGQCAQCNAMQCERRKRPLLLHNVSRPHRTRRRMVRLEEWTALVQDADEMKLWLSHEEQTSVALASCLSWPSRSRSTIYCYRCIDAAHGWKNRELLVSRSIYTLV